MKESSNLCKIIQVGHGADDGRIRVRGRIVNGDLSVPSGYNR
jgi:hypothetical protein